jgi:CDP-paratose 2-epimerase
VSVSLQELTAHCEEITGNKINIHQVKENRLADIPIYITDNSKITETCGWAPKIGAKQTLTTIFDWIKNNEQLVKQLLQ